MTNPISPIGRSTTGGVSNHTDSATNKTRGQSNTPVSANNAGDKVSLSQESQQVSSLQQQLNASPAIDQARVESIKQEIANGNYPLDVEKIANNLINLEQALIE